MPDEQVGYKIDEQHLPQGQIQFLLNQHRSRQQHRCGDDEHQLPTQAAVLMVVMLMFMMMLMMLLAMMVVTARMAVVSIMQVFV
jgi:hypothetical protein